MRDIALMGFPESIREVWLAKRSLLSLSEAAEFGGEGSRTPVLKTINPKVYMLSRSL